jgi:plasmid stability protein
MPAVTIRNLSLETHRALNAAALAHQRSTEAHIRHILDDAMRTSPQMGAGTAIHTIAMRHGGFDFVPECEAVPALQEAANFQ